MKGDVPVVDEIIYDSNNHQSVRKQGTKTKIGSFCLGIFLLYLGLFIIFRVSVNYGNYSQSQYYFFLVLGGMIGIPLLILGIYLFKIAFSKSSIKLSKKGIYFNEDFILYDNIEAFYYDECKDLTTFKIKEGKIYKFTKWDVHNREEFMKLLEGKVKIITDEFVI